MGKRKPRSGWDAFCEVLKRLPYLTECVNEYCRGLYLRIRTSNDEIANSVGPSLDIIEDQRQVDVFSLPSPAKQKISDEAVDQILRQYLNRSSTLTVLSRPD
jgi:hypothetical protein